MDPLRFRAPGRALPLAVLLRRIAPDAPGLDVAAAVRAGALRVRAARGRSLRDPDELVPPGARIEVVDPPAPLGTALAASEALPRGVEAWLGLAPAPPWPEGALAGEDASEAPAVRFRCVEARGGVALLQLETKAGDARALRATLARAGLPLLGDARFGGVLVEGGLRLRPDDRPSREGVAGEVDRSDAAGWPDEPVFPPDASAPAPAGAAAVLPVSEASLRALERGHPWVLTDSETGDAGRFRPGALVWLLRAGAGAPRRPSRVLARIEGEGAVAARVWAGDVARLRDAPSVEARVARALERRSALLASADEPDATEAFRLVHGEADGLPGLAIDRLGPLLRALVTGRSAEGFAERALDAVVTALAPRLGAGDPPVVRVVHLRDRPAGALRGVWLARGSLPPDLLGPDGRFVVRERGLRFGIDPGLGRPDHPSPSVGLFLDQRENRTRTAALARRGGRWLNLFAHTGAFSVALLAAGAREVVSVDLSAAYLRWLDENLAQNEIDPARHRSVKADGRRALARLPEGDRFDGIVLDPPTAAAAGRSFWSVRRDLPALVEGALGRLAAGGALLVCRNDRSGRGGLERLVGAAAERAGVRLAGVEPAPPGHDFPALRGFPEGDPFEGVIAHRASPDRQPRRSGGARAAGTLQKRASHRPSR